MTTQNETITFKDRALACTTRGFSIIPLRPESKIAVEKNWPALASNSISDIDRWNASDSTYNCGIVYKAEPGGFWALETDSPALARRYKEETGKEIPATLTTQSRVGRGHRHYKNTPASIRMGNIAQEDAEGFSVRCNNQYTVSALSVHPETKTLYEIINDVPPVPAPDDFIAWLLKQKKLGTLDERSGTWMDEPIAEGRRNSTLTAIGGALRRTGLDEENIYVVLYNKNLKYCDVPLPDGEVLAIAGSVSRYEPEKTTLMINGVALDGVDAIAAEAAALQKKAEGVSAWRANFRTVKELEEGEVRMLIKGFLPEGTTFIGALPGEGKTLLGLSITKALTTGEQFLGRFYVPDIVPVIYLIPESSSRAFRNRCEKFMIPNDRDLFLCRTISEGSTLRLDDPVLLEAVRTMNPVVILDTVIRFSDSNDENSAMENKQIAEGIIGLRQAGAIGVIGIHHSTKAMREKGMSLETVLRGTGDLAACADAVYGMLRDANLYDQGNGPNEIDVVCVKPRDFEPPLPFRIAASTKTDNTAIGLAPGIASVIDTNRDFLIVRKEASDADQDSILIKMVQEDPAISLQELEKATKISTWVIRTSLKRLCWSKPRGGVAGGNQWVHTRPKSGCDGPITVGQGCPDNKVLLQ